MSLETIKKRLQAKQIFLSEDSILKKPTVIGYDKQFRWSWMATQLNTFIAISDFSEEKITVETLEC